MMSSIRSSSSSSSSSGLQQDTSKIYPQSGGRFSDLTSRESPAHEAAFHRWNDVLTQKYTEAHAGTHSPEASLNCYPLYRAAQQNPDDVFRPGGRLETSTTLNNRMAQPGRTEQHGSFSLSKHQSGLPSQYTSMTTSLAATQDISQFLRRDNVFVTDPQPNGRYLNGLAYNSNTASPPTRANALEDAVLYPVSEQAFKQQEVSVPGSIPTESVRGSVPINRVTGELDFAGLRKNEYYKSPADYKHEFDGAPTSRETALDTIQE